MRTFSFEDNYDVIRNKIIQRLDADGIRDPEGFEIIKGFFVPSIKSEITEVMDLHGHLHPVVAVVAKSTGRMYHYSLAYLFPDEEVLR